MSPSDLLNLFATLQFGEGLWNPFRFLFDANGHLLSPDVIRSLSILGISLMGLCLILELSREGINNIFKNGFKIPFSTIVLLLLIIPLVSSMEIYSYFYKLVVNIGVLLQNTISGDMLFFLEVEVQNWQKNMVSSSKGLFGFSFLKTSFELLTPLGFITACAISFSMALLYLIPLIQALYIALNFFLGPIILPFALWKPTQRVVVYWAESVLAATIMGTITSIVYALIGGTNLINNINQTAENHILNFFYCIVLIILLISSIAISFKLFSATHVSLMHSFKMGKKPLAMLWGKR